MTTFPSTVVAAALYDTFATTLDAFDSLEMWLAITEEARYHLLIAPPWSSRRAGFRCV
ncbi:hypothetical protein ACTD5D_21590 [Nocardia takedensis]|uniref:hypothetical protein n=1 Tax=Nocardia takedensis TaxID=259390 RepID=UPI003F75FCDC